jgi:hypothetical protein
MGYSPFELTNGQQTHHPTHGDARLLWDKPIKLRLHDRLGGSVGVSSCTFDGCKERMKHWEDQERRDVHLNVGDGSSSGWVGTNSRHLPGCLHHWCIGLKVPSRYLRKLGSRL